MPAPPPGPPWPPGSLPPPWPLAACANAMHADRSRAPVANTKLFLILPPTIDLPESAAACGSRPAQNASNVLNRLRERRTPLLAPFWAAGEPGTQAGMSQNAPAHLQYEIGLRSDEEPDHRVRESCK